MGVNHVNFNGKTLIDLTGDTVTADKLFSGVTAHNAAGEIITGTYVDNETHEGVYCWQVFRENADITPVMTANETGEYIAFASTEISEPRQAWCAFDNISGTDQEANRWHGDANDLPGYIGMEFPEAVAVLSFSVKNASTPHYGIKGFSLQGSNDGTTWKTYGTYENPADWGVESVYTVASPAYQKYWRLYITSTHHVTGSNNYCIIDEIKFFSITPMGFVVSNDPDAYPSKGAGESGLYYVAIGAV